MECLLPNHRGFDIIQTMKNNNTTDKSTNSSTPLARFNYLKTLFRVAPLSESKLSELKALAKKFDPKMAKWIDEHPEYC